VSSGAQLKFFEPAREGSGVALTDIRFYRFGRVNLLDYYRPSGSGRTTLLRCSGWI